MKLSFALFLLYSEASSAFLAPRFPLIAGVNTAAKSPVILSMDSTDETDDYDDWYADFDPSDYEKHDNSNQGQSYGGNRSGDHDYTRDTSVDNSNVDLNTVNYLIGERLQLRKTGRFDQADAIRDELLAEHGVMVRDKERVWRSGCSASGSGQRWSPGQKNKGYDRKNRQTDFGPNGHDYNMARGAGPIVSSLSEKEIHELLAERLACKLARDYKNADMIQEELLEAGVMINDRQREWRADGASFDGYNSRKYNQSPHSAHTEDADEIGSLIAERAKAKSERLYKKADAIRDDLLDRFDVSVDDKRLEWSVGGDFGVVQKQKRAFEGFEQAPDSLPVEDSDEIQQLVKERDTARADRNFERADQIRDELMERNIYIDDRKRQWRAGSFADIRESRDAYNRRGGGSISEEDEKLIGDLLKKRFEHKKNRKFKSADSIRDRLRDEFQVQIDDRNREWHIVTTDYVMAQGSSPVSEDTKAQIEELVSQRAMAKFQRDYATADSIRDVLMQRYSVSMDDRVKEWSILNTSDFDEDFVEDEGDDFDEVLSEEVTILDDSNDLEKLTVPELKERLREAGLPVSGRKAELIERLTN